MLNNKKTVLIVVGYYLPGFKAGGPIRTISNLVESLGDNYNFKIITSDRDLGDSKPYNIQLNTWCKLGKAEVYYINQKTSILKLKNIINGVDYDILYLNSLFNLTFTIKPLVLAKFKLIKNKHIILAPRGELSVNALAIKKIKKRVFLKIFQMLGFYKKIKWHASTIYEKKDILNIRKVEEKNIKMAKNIPKKTNIRKNTINHYDHLKICFIARISPMKNLIYAIEILRGVEREVVFDIYGPIEDILYWGKCLKLLENLPSNINFKYMGALNSNLIHSTLVDYNILFVPSLGENYGHIYAEALSVGVPILVSTNTPWRNLATYKVGWDIDLEDKESFMKVIENFNIKDGIYVNNCVDYMENIINKNILRENREIFDSE